MTLTDPFVGVIAIAFLIAVGYIIDRTKSNTSGPSLKDGFGPEGETKK